MIRRTLASSSGVTYIGALVMVVILALMASRTAMLWKTQMQRERETELLWRGHQYMEALRRWYWPNGVPTSPTGTAGQPQGASPNNGYPVYPQTIPNDAPRLADLKDLLKGTGLKPKPCIRKLYKDPMFPGKDKDFDVIKDANQRIVGVKSTSAEKPIRQGRENFWLDFDFADFEGKKSYSEWEFICIHWPKPIGTGGQVKGLSTTGPGGLPPDSELPPAPRSQNKP
ncbi:type II secretion system protein [Geomonas sp. Red32]|uniref:type II secretion system protein n=1 Tax=Geomonas sp. Red32 TaxID=2912856 RepID=UPI00202CF1EA|nr:type II secretion system protein [Geomonas sp. Red32]MCM0080390.1 type II secretion system protein [Geomonas sp. Red32]